jgi:hypothetical protein
MLGTALNVLEMARAGDDQPGDGWFGQRHARGDGAAQAVAEHEHPLGIDGRMLPEQADRGDRLR